MTPIKAFTITLVSCGLIALYGQVGYAREDTSSPTIYIAGDSTASNGVPKAIGWGRYLGEYFETPVVNRARGGRSSRTFITEGLWDRLMDEVQAGDIVLIQFGHNDGGAINHKIAPRGSLPGIGDETEEIDNLVTQKHEVVHTFGWYMRKMVHDVQAKKAHPILLSLTVRNGWPNGRVERGAGYFGQWIREIAELDKVPFVDVTKIIADHYEAIGKDAVAQYFPRDPVHTSAEGAALNARLITSGLKGLREQRLSNLLSAQGRSVATADPNNVHVAPPRIDRSDSNARRLWLNLPVPGDPCLPNLILIGDSTVRNGRGDGSNGQFGWGDPLGQYFDPAQVNVVNRAVGGTGAWTFQRSENYREVLEMLKPSDTVLIQFGHNDNGPYGALRGVGEETEERQVPRSDETDTVHTFGWYLRQYARDIRQRGATPIICSLVPRKIWRDGKIIRVPTGHAHWARQAAEAEQVDFIDLYERIAQRYDALGPERVEPLFADQGVHTSWPGAVLNAECVKAGLDALASNPVARYYRGGTQAQVGLFPAQHAQDVNPDTRLILTFADAPTLGTKGCIRIVDTANDRLVDTLDMSIPPGPHNTRTLPPYDSLTYDKYPEYSRLITYKNRFDPPDPNARPIDYQINYIGGNNDGDAYHFYPVIIRDNTAIICPHSHVLEYGRTYRVHIDPEVFSWVGGPLEWTFTTKKSPPSIDSHRLVVSCEGSGDFSTVQGAIDFVPDQHPEPVTIFIKNGTYDETVYFRNKSNVTFLGESRDQVVICNSNNSIFNPPTLNVKRDDVPDGNHNRRAVFAVERSRRINIVNLTVRSLGREPAQAEGLLVRAREVIVHNVTIDGSGDALQATGSIYVGDSRITGYGDNVLGYGAVFFDHCDFVSTYGPHLWIRNPATNHGNALVNCTLRTLGDVETVVARNPVTHGVGFPDCEAVLIHCALEGIRPEGWGPVGGDTSNMRYWEYHSIDLDGNPVDMSQRHEIVRELTMEHDAEIIANYSDPTYVLGGWTPTMAPMVLTPPQDATVDAGQPVTFAVKVAAVPEAGYQWFKDGIPVAGADQDRLSIASVQPDDVGCYTVRATNSSGQVTSEVARLTLAGEVAESKPLTAHLDTLVMTDAGPIQGCVSDDVNGVCVFKAIPFAAPPVGENRWREPQPVEPWTDVRDCTEFGPACPQSDILVRAYGIKAPVLDEDCLFLNVFTPARSGNDQLPVMVWFYGGGFGVGDASTYDMTRLSQLGAVVVTINYRVGVLGFLAHETLSQESPHHVSGNYGLLDMVAALRWVQRNIAQFGGAADNVTIFGQSAGASGVCYLMASPQTQGLFHKAISQSHGAYSLDPTLEMAEETGALFFQALGCEQADDPLTAARSKSWQEVFALSQVVGRDGQMLPAESRKPRIRFWPNIDGWLNAEPSFMAFAAGHQANVPLLIGSNQDESDRTFTAGTRYFAQQHCRLNPHVYRYFFTQPSKSPYFLGKAAHAAEIAYIMRGNPLVAKVFDDQDWALSDVISRAWVQFARTGHPNVSGQSFTWPRYEAETDPYLELGTEIKQGTGIRPDICDRIDVEIGRAVEARLAVR